MDDLGNVCPFVQVLLGLCSRRRRWWNSWWRCRRFCPVPCSSSVTRSKSLTFLYLIVLVVEVFKVSLPDFVPVSGLWSRTWSFQFLVVVKVKVFKVFLPDMVPDTVLRSRMSTFQFLTLCVPVVVFQDSVLWNRPLTFQFCLVVVLFTVFTQDRVTEFNRVY